MIRGIIFSNLLLTITTICGQDFGCFEVPELNNKFIRARSTGVHGNLSHGLNDIQLADSTIEGQYIEYYETILTAIKQIKFKGKLFNGKKEGVWYEYNKNGNWLAKGKYENNLREGLWYGVHLKGGDSIITDEFPYDKGELNGQLISYFKGQLHSMYSYRNGVLEGKSIDYLFFNNFLEKTYKVGTISNYKNGLLDGKKIRVGSDGDTSIIYNYANGKLNGRLKNFTEDGFLEEIIPFKNDSIEGNYKKFHKNGQPYFEIEFRNDLPFNIIVAYDSLGRSFDIGSLKNGTGNLITYFPNGSVKSNFNYEQQLIKGEILNYYESGALHEKGIINASNDPTFSSQPSRYYFDDINIYSAQKQSFGKGTKYIIYYEDSTILSKVSSVVSDKDSNILIKYIYYSKNGKLSQTTFTKYGLLIGDYKSYYENGLVEKEVNYKQISNDGLIKSLKDGLCKFYYENGQLRAALNYKLGRERLSKFFNEEGELVRTKMINEDGSILNIYLEDTVNVTDRNGFRQGKWLSFPDSHYSNCTLEPNSVQYYKNGKPTGTWTRYNYNGGVASIYEWKDSTYAECITYHEDGKIAEKGKMTANMSREGLWQIFDSKKGYMWLSGYFRNNSRDGEWEVYRKNGKVKTILYYDMGNLKNGDKWEYWRK